jgi:hypothetical protein
MSVRLTDFRVCEGCIVVFLRRHTGALARQGGIDRRAKAQAVIAKRNPLTCVKPAEG